MDSTKHSKTPSLGILLDQTSAWASNGFGNFGTKKAQEPEEPKPSAGSFISVSVTHPIHHFSASGAANDSSLVEDNMTASADFESRTSTSSEPPNRSALPSHPTRDSTDGLSTSASLLRHQGTSHKPESSAMSASNPIVLTDEDGSGEEPQGSDTDDISLASQSYGPPLRDHFHQPGKLRRDSASSNESGGPTSEEFWVTITEGDEPRLSTDAHTDDSVVDGDAGESEEPSATPQPASSFGGDELRPTTDSSRDPSPNSDTDVANLPSSAEPAELPDYSTRGDVPPAQTSARVESSELENLHRAATSSSEHSSTRADDSWQERSNSSSPADTAVKPAHPRNDSGTPSSDKLAASDSAQPIGISSLPASISTQSLQTDPSGSLASIDIEIRNVAEKLAKATENRDQENLKITAASSEAAAWGQHAASFKPRLNDALQEQRDAKSRVKDVRNQIKDATDQQEAKTQEADAHVTARDKFQDSINELAYHKRKLEKKWEIARRDEMIERNIADPFLRRLAKKLQSSRDKRGDVDSDSDGDEYMGSSDEQDSDSEDESAASRSGQEDDGNLSETGSLAGEGDPESKQDTMLEHLDEFVDNVSKLARRKPEKMTMAEFSSIGNAYTKVHGNVKPEIVDDDKSAVKSEIKSEIKREPGIKTEADITPEPGQPAPVSNIKQERASIKHESSPSPFPGNNAASTLPVLDDLSLTTLTADGLAEDIKLAQYYQAKVSKTFALLNAPVTSPVVDTSSTQSSPPPGGEHSSSNRVTRQQSRRGSLASNSSSSSDADQGPSSFSGFGSRLARSVRRLVGPSRESRKRPAASPFPSDAHGDDEEDPNDIVRDSGKSSKKTKLRHE